ncbi:hypothetical protein OH76DRAFT_815568 [Lentinus brumalis]|uniref:Uncharacterized protein n=1 Tax=Lentinus brumalis TaxID=2498619 RepID=A0A371D2G8_9APHY|nr:hypothetical protein OH76DRAFT_815568 [Polyporus brumalis]
MTHPRRPIVQYVMRNGPDVREMRSDHWILRRGGERCEWYVGFHSRDAAFSPHLRTPVCQCQVVLVELPQTPRISGDRRVCTPPTATHDGQARMIAGSLYGAVTFQILLKLALVEACRHSRSSAIQGAAAARMIMEGRRTTNSAPMQRHAVSRPTARPSWRPSSPLRSRLAVNLFRLKCGPPTLLLSTFHFPSGCSDAGSLPAVHDDLTSSFCSAVAACAP